MSLKRILIAGLAALGLGTAHTASSANIQQSQRLVAAAKSESQSKREINADIFGRYLHGMSRAMRRDIGCPPDVSLAPMTLPRGKVRLHHRPCHVGRFSCLRGYAAGRLP